MCDNKDVNGRAAHARGNCTSTRECCFLKGHTEAMNPGLGTDDLHDGL